MFLASCCSKVRSIDTTKSNDSIKLDSSLVEIGNQQQLQAQIILLRQFDSMNVIITKQGRIIDSLTKSKSVIQYVDKIIYKEKLSSKYNDKQIDSIIQSNVNLRNIIKQQNRMKK